MPRNGDRGPPANDDDYGPPARFTERLTTGANPDQDITEYVETSPEELETPRVQLALQPDFYRIPRRFGSIPVDELPKGCDRDKQYYGLYPRISLPFQRIERVSFGHPKLEPNRLFWGDNLHVMRMLPSDSIDLIYIDPPFFSGKHYNFIFGDQNEVRSFSDIWEGGIESYQIWLNARLLEMKRLLKPTGSNLCSLRLACRSLYQSRDGQDIRL